MKSHAIISTVMLLLPCLASTVQVHAGDYVGRVGHCGPRHYTLPNIKSSEVHTVNGVSFLPVPDVLRGHLPGLPEGQGLMVASYVTCSASDLLLGDILISVDGQKITDFNSLPDQVLGRELAVIRKGKLLAPSEVSVRKNLISSRRIDIRIGSTKCVAVTPSK